MSILLSVSKTKDKEYLLTTQETTTPSSAPERDITVSVPEDRVAEFYAFYARFLAGSRRPGPSGRRRGRHGHGRHGRCHSRHGGEQQAPQTQSADQPTAGDVRES